MNKKSWKFFKQVDYFLIIISFCLNYMLLFCFFAASIKYDVINCITYSILAVLSFNNGVIIGDYIKLDRINTRSDFISYSKLWTKYINDDE